MARARGLTSTVLCRWQRGAGGQRPGLRPVIAPEAREPEAPVPALVLVTRGGGRLEGLGVAEAIQVLRALS
ncbi:MAG: hypothetical protein FJY75_04625 [Candidatus Eisenbacteria bacterium]|uniref:Uncharacterized protein n=1 Tax=Eiseniibacteriota bacterium TaxID=2212470 RepID=A0A937X7T0_UNCEI|nr:hypothetical protein [Candidatus Eisenbacteria bacterium]